MKFCLQFPMRALKHWDTWIDGHGLGDVAAAAEDAGFDMVSTTDHPFPSQAWLEAGGHHAFDPFVSLAFMAAATTRLRLLTMIVVAGHRHPYITAKAAGSLDTLSGGRLVLGMGAGYQQPEFEVVGGSFTDRGKRFDASIPALRAAWTGEVLDRDDEYFPAHGHVMLPRPAQAGGPPIWIGGNSNVALRRVAELADGWIPIEQSEEASAITKTPALGSADQLAERIAELRERRRAAGRSTDVDVCFAPLGRRDPDGNAEAIAENVAAYAAAGATRLLVESRARSFADYLREVELYRPLTGQELPVG
ncbi:MAG TPA: LLM class F420-dependent oxidoreductase [Modestobacter sp.]|nr:LLM class F420-dependent oxidoreductase [Modestobacter sp.]